MIFGKWIGEKSKPVYNQHKQKQIKKRRIKEKMAKKSRRINRKNK